MGCLAPTPKRYTGITGGDCGFTHYRFQYTTHTGRHILVSNAVSDSASTLIRTR